jgi:hypothetical protein
LSKRVHNPLLKVAELQTRRAPYCG